MTLTKRRGGKRTQKSKPRSLVKEKRIKKIAQGLKDLNQKKYRKKLPKKWTPKQIMSFLETTKNSTVVTIWLFRIPQLNQNYNFHNNNNYYKRNQDINFNNNINNNNNYFRYNNSNNYYYINMRPNFINSTKNK